MRRVRKYQYGSPVYPGLSTLSLKLETPNLLRPAPQLSGLQFQTPQLKQPNMPLMPGALGKQQIQETSKLSYSNKNKGTSNAPSNTSFGNQLAGAGVNVASNYLSGLASNQVFGNDTDLGRTMGTLFSSGVSSAGNTIANNLIKGEALTQGLGQNMGASLAGAGAGIAANYIGQGITSALGNNYAGRAIGAGVATGLGTVGGTAAGALATGAKIGTALSSINPYALAGNVIGSALSAGNGPSKEYGGRYGKITQGMDLAYDVAMVGVNAIPVVGQAISGFMALNKGLSNLFGSTDGMTKTDAILGSAFMPAPLKWANMWGASTTGTFNNQSWQNSQKANTFMGDAFGNLSDKFDKAREEAGKTYGTFSQGAKRDAQKNINFANYAWEKVMNMADQNELQNIRSQAMTSINNQRYAQSIGGAWQPMARGKYGMKILNNATNHNIGMRLLSGAALIDNKQMILCNVLD